LPTSSNCASPTAAPRCEAQNAVAPRGSVGYTRVRCISVGLIRDPDCPRSTGEPDRPRSGGEPDRPRSGHESDRPRSGHESGPTRCSGQVSCRNLSVNQSRPFEGRSTLGRWPKASLACRTGSPGGGEATTSWPPSGNGSIPSARALDPTEHGTCDDTTTSFACPTIRSGRSISSARRPSRARPSNGGFFTRSSDQPTKQKRQNAKTPKRRNRVHP
jgi:hypothetical protein